MAKFKGCYKNAYALQLMAEYFRNTLRYYKGEVADDDYFEPIVDLMSEAEVEKAILDNLDRAWGKVSFIRRIRPFFLRILGSSIGRHVVEATYNKTSVG